MGARSHERTSADIDGAVAEAERPPVRTQEEERQGEWVGARWRTAYICCWVGSRWRTEFSGLDTHAQRE